MQGPFVKARSLAELARVINHEPLEARDERYVDLSQARSGLALAEMKTFLLDLDPMGANYATIAFTGPRGCGKSTELKRLQGELNGRFECLYLEIDKALQDDCDYTELFLWLVSELHDHFQKLKKPLDQRLITDINKWYAEVVEERIDSLTRRGSTETDTRAGLSFAAGPAKAGFFARLRDGILGSAELRIKVRKAVQPFASDLIRRVNLLLDNARDILRKDGSRRDLLIVQDNLDRLLAEPARDLFYNSADQLKKLRVHAIYTIPGALVLAPYNIPEKIKPHFALPMLAVKRRDGRRNTPGINGLKAILAGLMQTDAIFEKPGVMDKLVAASGGSNRDLLRLIDAAQLTARTLKKPKIDAKVAASAVTKLRLEYEGLLVGDPGSYERLARIHRAQKSDAAPKSRDDPVAVEREHVLFVQHVFNCTILEYNGGQRWFDVHPVIQDAEAFKKASAQLDRARSAGR